MYACNNNNWMSLMTVLLIVYDSNLIKGIKFCQIFCDKNIINDINPLAGRTTFLSPMVHGRSDNIVVFP